MSNPNKEQRAFNATAAGQRAMCRDADSRGTALYMNRVVKQRGGTGWDDKMIETANDILLRAIKENLIEEFNALVKAKDESVADYSNVTKTNRPPFEA